MTDNELGMLLASIETAEDEKELQAITDALEKRKEQLKEERIAKETRAMTMLALFNEWQNKAEETLETLFNKKFHSCEDSLYIKITLEDMVEYLKNAGYKVERSNENEDSHLYDCNFTLTALDFDKMYLDYANDIIIPLEL